jgi:hypothetical protein
MRYCKSPQEIEENLLVTADGHRILGQPRPRTSEDVETIRKG